MHLFHTSCSRQAWHREFHMSHKTSSNILSLALSSTDKPSKVGSLVLEMCFKIAFVSVSFSSPSIQYGNCQEIWKVTKNLFAIYVNWWNENGSKMTFCWLDMIFRCSFLKVLHLETASPCWFFPYSNLPILKMYYI